MTTSRLSRVHPALLVGPIVGLVLLLVPDRVLAQELPPPTGLEALPPTEALQPRPNAAVVTSPFSQGVFDDVTDFVTPPKSRTASRFANLPDFKTPTTNRSRGQRPKAADDAPDPVAQAKAAAAHQVASRYQAHCAAARQHQVARRWSEALAELALAIQVDPTRGNAYLGRAEMDAAQSLYAQAAASLTNGLVARPDDAGLLGMRGAYRCSNRDPGGLADLDEAISRLNSRHKVAAATQMIRLRAIALRQLGDDRGAVDQLDALLAEDGGDPELFFQRGMAWLRLGEVVQAAADFDHAVVLDPTPRYRQARGVARFRSGRFAEALADQEASAAAFPSDLPTRCALGLTRCAAGRVVAGIALLDQLLKDHPDDGEVQTWGGWVALWTGDLANAQTWLSKAAGQPSERLQIGMMVGPRLLTEPYWEWAIVDFADRCREAPGLRWAFAWRTDEAAQSFTLPHSVFAASLACRLSPEPGTAPCLVLAMNAFSVDQPWKGAAVLGHLIVSVCRRDRAEFLAAAANLQRWLRGHETFDELWAQTRDEF